MTKQMGANLSLIFVAMLWGASYVAQSSGMDHVGPFTFFLCRSVLCCIVLLPILIFRYKKNPSKQDGTSISSCLLWLGGSLCGLAFFASLGFQQVGLLYTSVGKSGFITALYVVLVPIIGLFQKKKLTINVWIGAVLAVAALYLLCVNESLTIGPGELLTLGCALFSAIHITTVGIVAPQVDSIMLTFIQFLVCVVCSFIGMVLFETPSLPAIVDCWLPIAYAGLIANGIGHTLQNVSQKYTNSSIASILMSLESVFAVVFGALLLHEKLTAKEYLGCVLMFVAVILAQLPQKKQKKTDLV